MKSLVERDREVLWHPFTHRYSAGDPIPVVSGKGAWLFDEAGNGYLDGISSWWVNTHGHAHPYIAEKVNEQHRSLEHVIFAGFTHEPAVRLAERLLEKWDGGPGKVFFSDNGSTAMETAVKMALQYWYNQGQQRTRVIAFENGYHGDTFGAMSVSAKSAFNAPFDPLMFEVEYIPAPTPGREEEAHGMLDRKLSKGDVAAFCFEPLVQGASGMIMHESAPLERLVALCQDYGVPAIADEVFTGFGRTGSLFATHELAYKPDIMALSKGLTGGTMALAATLCKEHIHTPFYDKDRKKTFFHGHSYTANPLACTAANASLDLFEYEETWQNIHRIIEQHHHFRSELKGDAGVRDVRQKGTILAVELGSTEETSYFNSLRDRLARYFLEKGIFLRPLGNEVYVVPPYCITEGELDSIHRTVQGAIERLQDKGT